MRLPSPWLLILGACASSSADVADPMRPPLASSAAAVRPAAPAPSIPGSAIVLDTITVSPRDLEPVGIPVCDELLVGLLRCARQKNVSPDTEQSLLQLADVWRKQAGESALRHDALLATCRTMLTNFAAQRCDPLIQ